MKRTFNNRELIRSLREARNILIVTHIYPDGDALGSSLAMRRILKGMGKEVTVACADKVPFSLSFLKGTEEIVNAEDIRGKAFDTALAVDCSDEGRQGACFESYSACPVRLQIDHHGTNPLYAMENEVDAQAPAAGVLVCRLMHALGISPDEETAADLYCAISSDTGNFCFDGTDSETFEYMAEIMDAGLKISDYSRRLHRIREEKHVRMLACALSSLKVFANGRAAGMRVTLEDFKKYDALPEHSDRIVNYALDMPGIEMAYLADGSTPGFTKCSLRATLPHNVTPIAQSFGGGGHRLASGLRCDIPMDEFCEQVEKKIIEALGENE